MGQQLNISTNNYIDNANTMKDFICNKCYTHLLIELIPIKDNKDNILIRRYCFCGTLTTCVNEEKILLIQRNDFYQGTRCHQIFNLAEYKNPNITKYCLNCSNFLCDECALKHEHKNFIEAKDFIFNCKYHRDCKVIGFCKKCKISFCDKCIKNNYHPTHDIKYIDHMGDINKELKIFEDNLNNAFNKMNELIQAKYGQEYNCKITNLLEPQKIPFIFDDNDKEIILCLELLKLFMIYIFINKKIIY